MASALRSPSSLVGALSRSVIRPRPTPFSQILRTTAPPSSALRSTSLLRAYSTANDKAEEPKKPEEGEQQAATGANDLNAKVKELEELIEKKDKTIAELKDARLRTLADYENLQKRSVKEKAQAKDFALTSFAKELIRSIDVLGLALKSVPEHKVIPGHAEAAADVELNIDLVQLYEGLSLTKKDIEKVLSRHGVVAFDPTGEAFDPNMHEALYQAPVPGKEPGTVLETQEIGYTIKDRLLRPAKVGVVLSE